MQTRFGFLAAIASRSQETRETFGAHFGVPVESRYDTYEGLANAPDVDAVYIATPHPFHAQQSIMCLRAGKHVLCEKPAGLTADQVREVTQTARHAQRFFMEGMMYRCHPQIARLAEVLRNGNIGEITRVSAQFGFAAPFDPDSRLFKLEMAGGGILDVGVYPVSFARLIAGIACGKGFADPVAVSGDARFCSTGVDTIAHGALEFANGITADIACAITQEMDNRATVYGTEGRITLEDPWVPGRDSGPSDAFIEIIQNGERHRECIRHPAQLFTFEAEVACRAIQEGLFEAPAPAMGWADSVGNALTVEAWLNSVGYVRPT